MRQLQVVVLVVVSVGWAALAEVPAQAQQSGRVLGAVRDGAGAPVEAAEVSVDGKVVAATAADGTFALELPAGSHQVKLFAVGFGSVESTVVVRAGATTPMRYQLEPMTVGGEEINIVSRSPEKSVNVPASVGTVSEQEIKSNVSYQSGLANVTGVDVYTTGVGTSQVSTRGFYKQLNLRMISMVDGHVAQLPGAGLNLGDWAPASPLDMSLIEVVEGPSSSQYGANAVAGVVDVRTKSPWDESGVAMLARGGSRALVEGAARVAGTVGEHLGWKLNGQYLQADDWQPDSTSTAHNYGTAIPESTFVDDYGVRQLKLDGAGYFRFSDWQAKASTGFVRVDGMGLLNTGRWHARGAMALMSVAQLKSPSWFFSFAHTRTSAGDSYFIDQAVQTAARMGGVPATEEGREAIRDATALHDESQMFDAEAQYQHRLGRFELSTGTEARLYRPDEKSTYLAGTQGVNLDTAEAGVFVQGDTRFVDDRLRLIAAARLDVHQLHGTQVSPKLVSTFELAPMHVVRASISRAYKSPSIVEDFLFINTNSPLGVFEGNRDGFVIKDGAGNVVREIPALEPEVGTALEAGYKGVAGGHFFGELVGHYTFYDNFITPLSRVSNPGDMTMPTFAFTPGGDMVGNGALRTYFNFGTAQVGGGDVRGSYVDRHFMASASVSYLHVVKSDAGTAVASVAKELTLNVPEYKTITSVGVKNIGIPGWFVRIDGRWRSAFKFESGYWSSCNAADTTACPAGFKMTDGSPAFPDGKLPARFVLDAAAGYEIPHTDLTLSLVAKNVLDDDKLEILGAPAPRRFVFLQLEFHGEGLQY